MIQRNTQRNTQRNLQEPKSCYFCQQNIHYIDYKDVDLLRQFISGQAKILSIRRTGTCRKHQRPLAQAIKRARFLALLPFTNR